jgi:mono/diheme cytochrome c family protein
VNPCALDAEGGGLITSGLRLPGLWRRAAALADKIFKDTKPADRPAEPPMTAELISPECCRQAMRETMTQRMRRSGLTVGVGSLLTLAALAWGVARVTDKDLREGQLIYTEACAACHGDDGRGQVTGLGFQVPLPDFTWCAFNSEETDQDWQSIVTEGGAAAGRSAVMPSFREALTDEQIRQVVAFLRIFCREDWPRGELNFPRLLVTEKAWPENEVLITAQTRRTPQKEQKTAFAWIGETRLGPRGQVELSVPLQINDPKGGGPLAGIGDLEVGGKYVLYDSLDRLAIASGGLNVTLPTGSLRRGLGSGTTILAPFLAAGKAWEKLIGQASLAFEYPTVERRAPKSLLYNLGVSYPVLDVGRLTEGQALLELNGTSEWGTRTPKHFQLFVTPGFRKVLNRSGTWAAAVGVQVPMTGPREAEYQILGYLLYELPPFRLGR